MRKFLKFSGLLLSAVMGTAFMCSCEAKSDIMPEPPPIEAKYYSFNEIENISDEELINLADYAQWNYPQSLFVDDHFDAVSGENFYMEFVPEGADLDEYCKEEHHYPMYSEYYDYDYVKVKCKNRLIENIEDNDVYSAWKGSYTEAGPMGKINRHENIVFMKNFSEDGNRYTGEMTADEIARNFDVLTYDPFGHNKICRRVVETEDAFVYEYYDVVYGYGDWNLNCTISLIGRSLSISKEDGSFPAEEQDDNDRFYCRHGEKITYKRTCEIPDSAPKQPWDE